MTSEAETARLLYRRGLFRKSMFMAGLVALGTLLCLIALGTGPMEIGLGKIIEALQGVFSHMEKDAAETVILNIRLPRAIIALLSGFGLAIAGAQMQIILRNPLASPFTLGVASGAALGAGLAIITGFSFTGGRYFLVGNAFVFALLPAGVIFLMSRGRRTGYGMLILAGIAMNFIFSAVSTLLSYYSNSEELKSLSLWMMGSLGRATWQDIAVLAIILAISIPLLFLQNQKLNALNSGDESAKGLGVNVETTRLFVLAVSSLAAAGIVCFTGIIGFVGLVAPHITRLLIGNNARFLIPASGLFGAVFLLGADVLALKVMEPAVLPVGIVTSFVGGPLLFILITKKRREMW